ncbi:hypothetical protein [Lapillicoccus sp.]|uniref:hypothetical protein n=1 Tax=Lapillicoccus sp. TaxID=1909287 RepID=UPI0025FAF5F0|nr:hypothetical protein [Lapillicoccus sp.]
MSDGDRNERRSRDDGRSRPVTACRGGPPPLAVGPLGLAIAALAIAALGVVALTGCSAPVAPPPVAARPASTALPNQPSAPVTTGAQVDVVRIEKCWTTATQSHGGQLLVKASSSDPAAHLLVYRSDGSLVGEARNGGGGRYGGSVMAYQRSDPGRCIVRSSAGGTSSAPSGPFQTGS